MQNQAEIQKLLVLCGTHSQTAFEQLYQQASPKLYGTAMRLLQNSELADEALQEAFVHIWHKASEYDPEKGSAFAWMATIVRYRALDIIRREKSQQNRSEAMANEQLALQQGEDFFIHELHVDEDQHLQLLQECLKALDSQQRKSVLLSYYYGYSHSEMVTRLKRPLGTIKSWIRRGMESVRECMQR
ncbi:RNA polymerase sigma-70 factor, ECF subfamily [uncultured Thiomicrorhabdus sp.]|jgi:RNA polymerase sigma-70 factor (ECF subfamily)